MANRKKFFFKQTVTHEELNAAFDGLENADRALAVDTGVFGVIMGGVVTQHDPTPNLTVDINNDDPAFRAYDVGGQRLFTATTNNLNVSVDEFGLSTAVTTAGQERWLAIFAEFVRTQDDLRTDGNGSTVYFNQNESVRFFVRKGNQAASGAASRVSLNDGFVLLADVLRVYGDTQILNAAISTTRRQDFVIYDASQISLDPDDITGQSIITAVNVGEALGEIGNALEDYKEAIAETDDPPGSGATDCGATFIGVREYSSGPFTSVFTPAAGELDGLLEQLVGLSALAAANGHFYVDEVAAVVPASGSVLVALSVQSIRPSMVNVYCEAADGTYITASAVHYVGTPTNKWCVKLFNSSASDVNAVVEYSRRYPTV